MFTRLLTALSLSRKGFFRVVLGCAVMAFTIVNIHSPAQITEGGVLGLSLFSHKVLGLNPSIVSPLLDFGCIALGLTLFGQSFRRRTALASISFALFYQIALAIGPVIPSLYDLPFAAAILGGIGIGAGCGMVVTQGGAAGGDDVLAFVLSRKSGFSLARAYLLTDAVVLLLSLMYIPVVRLVYSLVTTMVSSFLIGQFEVRIKPPVLPCPTAKTGSLAS